ncbi:hypothetical protein MUP77_04365, partial [Candidatus Bathyarchaeota archaeon]|nr:hypothetical protein [Candidatus Bathyarchaeota archaeon]
KIEWQSRRLWRKQLQFWAIRNKFRIFERRLEMKIFVLFNLTSCRIRRHHCVRYFCPKDKSLRVFCRKLNTYGHIVRLV